MDHPLAGSRPHPVGAMPQTPFLFKKKGGGGGAPPSGGRGSSPARL